MDEANRIIRDADLNIPPVPNPGCALLFLGLQRAKLAGQDVDLDYRNLADRWIVLQRGHSSSMPQDFLPFSVAASETGAIEYDNTVTSVEEILPALSKLFHSPLPLACDPPEGFSIEKHNLLSRVVAQLPQPFSRKMLVVRLELEARTNENAEISLAHVKSWLSAMRRLDHLAKSGSDRRPQYRVQRNST